MSEDDVLIKDESEVAVLEREYGMMKRRLRLVTARDAQLLDTQLATMGRRYVTVRVVHVIQY